MIISILTGLFVIAGMAIINGLNARSAAIVTATPVAPVVTGGKAARRMRRGSYMGRRVLR